MEGIILDKRKFCWLNDNDAYFLFQKEIEQICQTEECIDSQVEKMNARLFEQYQHLFVTKDNKLLGWDGLSYHLIAENLEDLYEGALDIP